MFQLVFIISPFRILVRFHCLFVLWEWVGEGIGLSSPILIKFFLEMSKMGTRFCSLPTTFSWRTSWVFKNNINFKLASLLHLNLISFMVWFETCHFNVLALCWELAWPPSTWMPFNDLVFSNLDGHHEPTALLFSACSLSTLPTIPSYLFSSSFLLLLLILPLILPRKQFQLVSPFPN
jgi:hypothetical protein